MLFFEVTNWPAFLISWGIVCLWAYLVTMLIDGIGVMFGWWTNEDDSKR